MQLFEYFAIILFAYTFMYFDLQKDYSTIIHVLYIISGIRSDSLYEGVTLIVATIIIYAFCSVALQNVESKCHTGLWPVKLDKLLTSLCMIIKL